MSYKNRDGTRVKETKAESSRRQVECPCICHDMSGGSAHPGQPCECKPQETPKEREQRLLSELQKRYGNGPGGRIAGRLGIKQQPTEPPYRIRYRPVGAAPDSELLELSTLVTQIEIIPEGRKPTAGSDFYQPHPWS